MKPTPFNPQTDIPPIPFDERHCRMASELKEAGLDWKPHVGCFVWDRDGHIEVSSPFPGRIYFILNLGHFLRLLGSPEDVVKKLIWLPTWHQARLLCNRMGVSESDAVSKVLSSGRFETGEDLLTLYQILLGRLQEER